MNAVRRSGLLRARKMTRGQLEPWALIVTDAPCRRRFHRVAEPIKARLRRGQVTLHLGKRASTCSCVGGVTCQDETRIEPISTYDRQDCPEENGNGKRRPTRR